MAKFCGKCGAKLDEASGLCPDCDAAKIEDSSIQKKPLSRTEPKQEVVQKTEKPLSKTEEKKKRNAGKKAAKKAKKKEKRAKLTTGQKVCRFFLKLFLWLILLVVIAGGTIAGLSYMGIIDIPVLSEFNEDNILETLNERAVVVEKTDIVMKTDTEGTATVIVKMPNYELLFKEAYASENPDQYLVKALALGDYEIREYEEVVTVTVADDVTTIHSDEVVHKLLEEALINAINALSEVE